MGDELLARIARALDEASIPYMVIGGQAVLVYGFVRLTEDIDITLGAGPDQLPAVKQAATAAGLRQLLDDDFVLENLVFPAEDEKSRTRVDLILSFGGYESEALTRTHIYETGGYPVAFASIEDVLIHKVVAGRAHDLRDATELLVRHAARVDRPYVERWLDAFGNTLSADFVRTFDELWRDATR